MFFVRKILASIFAQFAFGLLLRIGWKHKTVLANLLHVGVAENAANKGREGVARVAGGIAAKAREKMYCRLLQNLARHAGELLFCFKTFKKLPADLGAYPCRVNGWNFNLAPGSAEILEKMRHGGIFLTAHYGNYEAMGPWLCRLGIPLVASYIPVKPAWLNRILEGRIRAVGGHSYSVNAQTPREFLRLLDEGKLFCLLADQDSRIASAQEGLFMGKSVHNNPLPEFLLKHRPETPVFVCWIEECFDKGSRGSQGMRCGRSTRILHAERFATQFDLDGSASVMARFNAWLQFRIVENPALWYGFTHRRFYSKNPEIYK